MEIANTGVGLFRQTHRLLSGRNRPRPNTDQLHFYLSIIKWIQSKNDKVQGGDELSKTLLQIIHRQQINQLDMHSTFRDRYPSMSSTQNFRIPSLDGFRAVAIVIVFLSHAGMGHVIPGGFGVTIFFFLSGYLITTLLRKEYELNGAINFKNFYLRRAYRIFPSMYLVLFSILIAASAGMVGSDLRLNAVMAQVFHLTNYYVIFNGAEHIVTGTGVYWSLAIEEHFYLVFPLLFLGLVHRWRYPVVAKFLFGMCVLALVWRMALIYGWNVPESRIYSATDTRLDSLLFGCIMGVWANPVLDKDQDLFGSDSIKIIVLALSIGLLLVTLVYRNEAFRQTVRYSLQGIALFPIFWLAIKHAEWPVFRWLNWRPVRGLGNISYTFYLSNFFWLWVVNGRGGLLAAGILGFGLTVVFSTIVYWVVEEPFAELRRKQHGQVRTNSLQPSQASITRIPYR